MKKVVSIVLKDKEVEIFEKYCELKSSADIRSRSKTYYARNAMLLYMKIQLQAKIGL